MQKTDANFSLTGKLYMKPGTQYGNYNKLKINERLEPRIEVREECAGDSQIGIYYALQGLEGVSNSTSR